MNSIFSILLAGIFTLASLGTPALANANVILAALGQIGGATTVPTTDALAPQTSISVL